MEGEKRCSGSRLSPQLAFVWWLNENCKKKILGGGGGGGGGGDSHFSLVPIYGEISTLRATISL